MAHQVFGDPITVSTTAQSLTALLGINDITFGPLTIRAETSAKGQAGRIWIGRSAALNSAGSHALGYLDAGDAIGIDQLGSTHTDAVWVCGTNAGDKAYVFGVSY